MRLLLPLILLSASWLHLHAAAPSFAIEVQPESLELPSCSAGAPLIVVARNTGQQPIADLALTTTPDPRFNIAPFDPPPTGPLQAGDQRRWNFRVTCAAAFNPSSLFLIATARSSTDSSALSQIIVKPIAIKLRPPDALDAIAAVDIKSNLDLLTQATAGDLLVAVTNKTSETIHIKVWPQSSDSILVKLADNKTPATQDSAVSQPINGGDTFTFRFAVTARTRVSPGKQLLGVNVHLEGTPPRDFLVTRDVTVGILGESEALKLLGIPSLLFLPGFLVMTSFLFLWRANVLRLIGKNPTIDLTITDPAYWVVSIAISALVLIVFVLFRRNFLSLYGLEDIGMVWLVSIFLGVCLYLIPRVIDNRKMRKTFPQETDTPLDILRKLSLWKYELARPYVALTGSDTPVFLLLQQPDGSIYVCPRMILTWNLTHDTDIKAAIDGQLDSEHNDPAVVVRIFDELARPNPALPYGKSGIRSFRWDTSDIHCVAPRLIATDRYTFQKNSGFPIIPKEEDHD